MMQLFCKKNNYWSLAINYFHKKIPGTDVYRDANYVSEATVHNLFKVHKKILNQMKEFFCSVFSGIRTEYGEIFRIQSERRKCRPEKLQIRALFTQCLLLIIYFNAYYWQYILKNDFAIVLKKAIAFAIVSKFNTFMTIVFISINTLLCWLKIKVFAWIDSLKTIVV